MFNQIIYCILAFLSGMIITGAIFYKKYALLNNDFLNVKAKYDALIENKSNEENILEIIKKEFNLSANEILLQKQKNLQEQNRESLESFLNPLKEKIKEFQEKVEKYDETGKINHAQMKQQIEDLIKQNQLTMAQTEKLSSAISSNSKYRGLLGEMILDKILKSSGLINKKDNPKGNFETQVGFKSADDTQDRRIVDAIVYLTDGKSIIIDSKASVAEFINFTQAEDEEAKNRFLSAFMDDVSDRVKELSGKYTNLEGLNTPDFTIMFIPFEYPLTYIYSNNKLIEDAYRQNVIIAGPSTLIATLRTVGCLWAQKNQYDNIKEIAKLGIGIYEKCCTFLTKMEGVKTSFETLRKSFDGVFQTLTGRGGLIGQVEKLKEFGLNSPKQINEKYLEDKAEEIL